MRHRIALLAPVALAAGLAVSAPAEATSFTGNGAVNITNGSGAFYDAAIPSGGFTDTIDFSVPSVGTADVGMIYFLIKGGLSSLSATFNGAPITFGSLGGNLYGGGISASVASGPQQIVVTGTSEGAGSYSGNVTFSAVPEIATWLMMIAGVGLTGVALRRRKQAYTVNYAF